jgi:RES domain-containing protein
MKVFRISPERFAFDLTGEGARLQGGRWNRVGKPALYTAESPSLAMLEIIAYFEVTGEPPDLVLVTLDVPDNISTGKPSIDDLPINWDIHPKTPSTQNFGSRWLEEAKFACLRVPSVIAPLGYGWNYVLNPLHPELVGKIIITDSVKWEIDQRISRKLL